MGDLLTEAGRNAMLDGINDLLNGGSLKIVTSTSIVLVTFTFGTPAFAAASGGSVSANAIAAAACTGWGLAQFADLYSAAGVRAGRLTIGSELALNITTLSAGDQVTITAFTITQPPGVL